MQAVAALRTLPEAQADLVRSVDLDRKSFTDVGGYDGKIAYLAHCLGAVPVYQIDSGEWREYGWPQPTCPKSVWCVTPADLMTWDIPTDVVACFNVLYHLEDPIGGLRKLRELTRERLLLCTSFVPGPENYWRLYDESDPTERIPEGATRYTNYFKPTISGLYRALKRVGFTVEPGAFTVGDHVLLVAS